MMNEKAIFKVLPWNELITDSDWFRKPAPVNYQHEKISSINHLN
jgi:hypothetical protein